MYRQHVEELCISRAMAVPTLSGRIVLYAAINKFHTHEMQIFKVLIDKGKVNHAMKQTGVPCSTAIIQSHVL